MSILNKITQGDWYSNQHNILVDKRTGRIGQAFIVNIPRHENKFAPDLEGQANAKVWAASKEMLSIIERLANTEWECDPIEITNDAKKLLNALNK